jgi:putative Mg2+ transporter-C (MgtC) family protein
MLTTEQIIGRLTLATVLGICVGFERGRLERAAGLRTHAMVALGSALFMIVSAFGFVDVRGIPQVVLDPSRVAAQVVSGIGFLGAGTIILRREIVRGLTTAASVWAVAAVGLAVGGGLYLAAIAATVLALLVLAGVKPLEQRLYGSRTPRTIRLTIKDSKLALLQTLPAVVESADLRLERIVLLPGTAEKQSTAEIVVGQADTDKLSVLRERLSRMPGVVETHVAISGSRLTKTRARMPSDELQEPDSSQGINKNGR